MFANGANGKTLDASHADKLGGVSASSYQKRVSGQCTVGSSIRSAGADGAVVRQNDGLVGYEVVQSSSAFDTRPLKSVYARCPTGKKVIGDGGTYSMDTSGAAMSDGNKIAIQSSMPSSDNASYNVAADWMGGSGAYSFSWRVISCAIYATV